MRIKRAILNMLTSLILQIVILLSGFITKKVIIQWYGSEVNGLVSSITQFLAYITLLESGVGPVIKAALYKAISKKEENEINSILFASEKFFKKIATIFLVYLLVMAVFYPFIIHNQFEYWYTFSLVIIISLSTFVEYYFGMTYKLFLQSDQKSYITATIQIVAYIINLLAVVIMVKLGFSIQIVKLVTAFVYVLRPILQNVIVKKKYNINLKNADKNYVLKQKWDGLAQHIAAIIHANTDITILTFMSTLNEVSIYSVYATVTSGIRLIIQSFNDGIDSLFGNMLANSEAENLKKAFSVYEILYFTVVAILYACTFLLITPFVKIYTFGVNDLDYCRPLFGYLLVASEFVWAIRQPYNSIIKSAGHFKETRISAWVEAGVNVVLSVILVKRYGLVGIAIGTLIAMLVRTIVFVIYANRSIIKANVVHSVKKIIGLLLEIVIIVTVSNFVPTKEYISYNNWLINALFIFLIALFVTVTLNYVLYKEECKIIFIKLKSKFNKILNRKKDKL